MWKFGWLSVFLLAGCSGESRETRTALDIGSHNLKCQRGDVETALARQSAQVLFR